MTNIVIPGIATLHQRQTWEDPRYPVKQSGQSSINWTLIDTSVPHYTAALNLPDGDPGENASQLSAYMRAVQQDYLLNRGYSIGYNFAIDWLGGVWECRGFDIKCAANADHNTHTIAILCLVDGNDPLTSLGVQSMRAIIADVNRRAKKVTAIVGHGQLQNPNHPTGCPGSGVREQIATGLYNPIQPIPPDPIPPTPTPTKEDNDMSDMNLLQETGDNKVFGQINVRGSRRLVHLTEGDYLSALSTGAGPLTIVDDIALYGTILGHVV